MSLANTSIASRLAARNANNNTDTNNTKDNTMFNSNTSNTMTNIKSVEIVLNIAMTSGIIPARAIQTWQSKNKSSIINTRSYGRINYNSSDDSVYASFLPLCEKDVDAYGRNNRAIVIFHLEDGTSKTLNRTETVKFWNSVLNVENAEDIKFSIKANPSKAAYDRPMVQESIETGRIRSLRIVWEGTEDLFSFSTHDEYGITLFPNEAAVNFHSKTVDSGATSLSFNLNNEFFVEESAANAPNFSKYGKESVSTSTKRREARKSAQTTAAREGVAANGRKKATVSTATVVETPAATTVDSPAVQTVPTVDVEKEALRSENAELKAQVADLTANVAKLTSMMEAFMASQAQPAPLSVEADAVEREIQQTMEYEETVVEAKEVAAEEVDEPKAKTTSEADFLSGLGRARARKTATTSYTIGDTEVDEPFNFMDDE